MKKVTISTPVDLYLSGDNPVTVYSPLMDLTAQGASEQEAVLMFLDALRVTAEIQESNIVELLKTQKI